MVTNGRRMLIWLFTMPRRRNHAASFGSQPRIGFAVHAPQIV